MASIFDKYGIKEVVDGTFYALSAMTVGSVSIAAGQPVLFLDTLKVSTVETTAEEAIAKGGRGNASLITWDFGKEINVSLQDALISPLSWALTTGATVSETSGSATHTIKRHYKGTIAANPNGAGATIYGVAIPTTVGNISTTTNLFTLLEGATSMVNTATLNTTAKAVLIGGAGDIGKDVEVFFETTLNAAPGSANSGTVITISADTFPGTYKFVGDTVIRNAATGVDEAFQIVIEKCKIKTENTITMEAEGDPSVFDMNLRVLKDGDDSMIRYIKYQI